MVINKANNFMRILGLLVFAIFWLISTPVFLCASFLAWLGLLLSQVFDDSEG